MKVAITDTGVDNIHEDLAGNMWVNLQELNGVKGRDDDNNGYGGVKGKRELKVKSFYANL